LDPFSPQRGGIGSTLRAGLNAGLAVGAVLGVVDGLITSLRTPVEGLGVLAACLCGAAVVYGLAYAAAALVLGALAHPWLRRRSLGKRVSFLTALTFSGGLFLELFWWTRPWVLYGVPATDPRRLAAAAGMLLLSLFAGFALVRAASRISNSVKWIGAVAVVVLWLVGAPFLLLAKRDADQLGRLNERNRNLPNVLFVVNDALRADVLGCYGNPRVKTPVMDALAAKGVLFENAFVQAPFTGSSFGTFFTGKFPRRHGFVKMVPGMRMVQNITFASHLDDARLLSGGSLQPTDYHSVTFMTGALSQASGLMRGFDSYFEAMEGHELVDIDNPWSVFRSELVLYVVKCKLRQRLLGEPVKREAIEWFERNGRKRFFAMVHFYSTHTPYDPPADLRALYCDPEYDGPVQSFYAHHREMIERGDATPTAADKRQIQNLYYAGVTHCDRMLGEILDELDSLGVLDGTIVVVTADHGEELDDHGLWEHNHMFNTNLRVPFLVSAPGRLPGGARVNALVDSIDLVPSLCELIGLEVPHEERPDEQGRNYGQVDGASWVALAKGEVAALREFSFAENGLQMSIQDREWKLIVPAKESDERPFSAATLDSLLQNKSFPPQLFHLALDPHELHDVLGEHRAQAERLLSKLIEWDAAMPIARNEISTSERDKEAEARRLRELGYADGVGQDVRETTVPKQR